MKCILTERECRSEGLVASLDCWEEIESLICPVPGSNGLGPVRTTFHEPSMASTARSMLFGALPLPIARAGASQKHSPAFGLYARLVRRSEQPNHLYSIFRPLLTSLVCSSSENHSPRPNFPSWSSYHNRFQQHGICFHSVSHSLHTSGRSQHHDLPRASPL